MYINCTLVQVFTTVHLFSDRTIKCAGTSFFISSAISPKKLSHLSQMNLKMKMHDCMKSIPKSGFLRPLILITFSNLEKFLLKKRNYRVI